MSSSKIPVINIVACMVPDLGIGIRGKLPWRLPREMRFFKQVTCSTFDENKQNAVIMGRKTWESIPSKFRPLERRLNVVVSRGFGCEWDVREQGGHVIQSNSLTSSIRHLRERASEYNIERIYVIGGAEVYNQCFELSDSLLVTEIEPTTAEIRSGDLDTFLNKDKVQQLFQKAGELRAFLPQSVELPVQNCLEENGFKFGFHLYNRLK